MVVPAELAEAKLTRLYDQLARFQWWSRCLQRARPGQGLAMRKRLRPGACELAGVERLNSWLWQLADPEPQPRVLDLGAGFGDTLLSWAGEHSGQFLGLGLSSYQVARATAQARALGLAQQCRFVQEAFDAPLPGSFDLIVSVETLFHAPDVQRTLRHVASALSPGGVLVLVEDMAVDAAAAASPAGSELCRRWSTPRLHSHHDYLQGLRDGGLELEVDHDLSGLLAQPTVEDRQRRHRRLSRLRRWLPFGRPVLDAFLGGLAMEEMQDRGDLCYRAMRARCPR